MTTMLSRLTIIKTAQIWIEKNTEHHPNMQSRVLREKATREQAMEAILTHVLPEKRAETDPEMRAWVEHVVRALADVDDWETVFYAVGLLLADRICLIPEHPTPWEDIWEIESHVQGAFPLDELKLEHAREVTADLSHEDYFRNAHAHTYRADTQARAWLEEHGWKKEMHRESMSSLELVLKTAERLGSLVVRWLQNAKRYVALPPKYEQAFNAVFHEVSGQSKLAAVAVVEREWPEVWEHIARFGDRIGGGSLMSVYEVTRVDGARRAMRVCNPNIQVHLGATAGVLRQTVTALSKRGVLKPDRRLAMDASIDLVEEWVRRDVTFADARARDERFRALHQGRDEGMGYHIRIPIADGPENRFFQMEELIPGHDLTEWQTLAETNDMRLLVATLARNFVTQVGAGLIHPDLNPGNIRVTDDGDLAYLDRTFLMDLAFSEQLAVGALLSPTPDVGPLRDLLAQGLSAAQRAVFDRALVQTMRTHAKDPAAAVRALSAVFRDVGAHLPLSLTLLLRGAEAVDDYAKKAGFAGFAEAVKG